MEFIDLAFGSNPNAAIGCGLHDTVRALIGRLYLAEEAEDFAGHLEAVVFKARRRLRPREDPTAPRKWAGNGLSRICGPDRMDVL